MIDARARTAVDDLRATTRSDVEAGLLEVYAGHRHHRRHNLLVAAAAVALALGVGWWGGHTMTHEAPERPQPVAPRPGVEHLRRCSGPVTCLGHSTYRFALTRPVTWKIPYGYGINSGSGATDWLVESYADRSTNGGGPYQYDTVAGVTVIEGVRAASPDGSSAQPGVADTPRAFVSWLATRPYLAASTVSRVRVDGRPAWHVRVSLARGAADGPALCNSTNACYATTFTPDQRVTGIWGDMTADYTAFRLPGAGTTVVWSWAFSHDTSALARNRLAVAGLSWNG